MNALFRAASDALAFCAAQRWHRVETDIDVLTCSAEDLVVLKAFAGRPQDWLDVEGILARQGSRLDRSLIIDELRPLLALEDDIEAEPALQQLFSKDGS